MTNQQRSPITFERWLLLVIDQTESREKSDPRQPLDESKDTRRFIVLSPRDRRPVFNCIECVSKKTTVNYPDVELSADGKLFTRDTIARVGMIYTLSKSLHGLRALGSITDTAVHRKITIGLQVYLPTIT
jgi:hypothetical protein